MPEPKPGPAAPLCRWCKQPVQPPSSGLRCSYIYVASFDSTQPFHDECLSEIWRLANAKREGVARPTGRQLSIVARGDEPPPDRLVGDVPCAERTAPLLQLVRKS